MDKKTKKYILVIVILAFLFNTGVCIVDYFNIFSCIGVNIENLNFDLLSLVVGNSIVVVLFLITYFIVDSRSINKDKNQLVTAYITLIGIYERCNDMVELFSKDDLRERAAKRCDGDKYVNEDKAHMHFLNYPFENESKIYDFAGAGILSKEVFAEFVKIKQHYQKYINVSIVFYDNYSQFKPVEKEISKELATALSKLKQYVENS